MASSITLAKNLISETEAEAKSSSRCMGEQIEHWAFVKSWKLILIFPNFIKAVLIAQQEDELGQLASYTFDGA